MINVICFLELNEYLSNNCCKASTLIKVKSMQRSGTKAIRTQPSKPKRKITNITDIQNTKRTYYQPSEQLFSKRWPLSNRNRTKKIMNTRKVKRHRNSGTKNRQQRTTTKLSLLLNALERSVINYCEA